MNAKLLAVAGPSLGSVFPLREEPVSIGREPGTAICIEDRSVSRQHCVIALEEGRWKLADLGSHNRTYVNGLPIEQCFLSPGDEIKIGRAVFLFLPEEEQVAQQEGGLQLEDESIISESTVLLRREDAVYLNPQKATSARTASDLVVLLKVAEVISSVPGLSTLQQRLMELIFEAVPAECGLIILATQGSLDNGTVFQASRFPGSQPTMRVSRTIIDRVLAERISLCANNVLGGKDVQLSESILQSQLSSLLAVPLVAFEKVIGAIYLGSSVSEIHFDEGHLQLVTGMAGIAAGALENALRVAKLESENQQLQAATNIDHNMVGQSPRMRQIYKFISKVAPAESTVLVEGESGTGKELVARAIHRNSPRAGKPFVAINCATLTETLLESELFGHERGAFTGAVTQKKGKLEEATGGSIFLDELGELALPLQAKMLRVLQEREFERVGGVRTIKTDVRVIAATNRNLKEAVAGGTFRDDLYHRLNVVAIAMPPVRERREDIPALARYFIEKHGRTAVRKIGGCSEEALACLTAYDWPGNVRELENAIERAIVLGSTELILPDDLPDSVLQSDAPGAADMKFHEMIRQMKRQMIAKALEQANGSYAEAAKSLGLHPNNLHRLMKSLNLKAAR